MVVPYRIDAGFDPGDPEVLFPVTYFAGRLAVRSYDVASDGRFLMLKYGSASGEAAASPQISVILDWFERIRD